MFEGTIDGFIPESLSIKEKINADHHEFPLSE